MRIKQAKEQALGIVAKLRPFCHKVEIAGSIRLHLEEISSIDIVCIPLWVKESYQQALFPDIETQDNLVKHPGFIQAVAELKPFDRPDRRIVKFPIEPGLTGSIFTAEDENFGLVLMQRTGNAAFFREMCRQFKRKGFFIDKTTHLRRNSKRLEVCRTEEEVFEAVMMKYVPAVKRKFYGDQKPAPKMIENT